MAKYKEPEIVEDSEPEREAQRQRAKQAFASNRVARLPKTSEPLAEDYSSELEVISAAVLPGPSRSTSTSHPDASLIGAFRGAQVIEISDESFLEPTDHIPTREYLSISERSSPTSSSSPPIPFTTLPEQDEPTSPAYKSKLSKHRYIPPTRPTRPNRPIVRCASTSSVASDVGSKSAPTKRATVAKRTHALSSAFTDTDLEKVPKCLSCTTRWTVRKSAHQKVTHMISCGKKNGITVATLTVMIAREIGVAAKVPVPETKTSTLYGSMVGADEPKKAGKRAVKAPVTLSNVPLAQQGIMNRAMELIGTSSTASADCSVRSQAIQGSSSRRTSDALNNTHIFGESALAGLYGSSSRMTGAEDPSDPFPLTQGFAPSALGSMHAATTSAYREQLGANSPPRGDYTAPSPTHQRKSRSRSHSVQSDEGRWPDAGEAGGVYFSWDDEGVLAHDQNDDAFLHFSPERRAAQINPIQDIPTLQDEPRLFAPKPTSKKDPKGKKKAAMTSTVDDWESRLKDLIVADKELHLRILRYEPIPFSTFMEKVGMNLSAQTQKQKLRGVLDELGVNTYAVSGMIGRKRTKK